METSEFQWEDEEFDDSFFQEVDKLEELAIATQNLRHKPSSSSSFAGAGIPSHSPSPAPVLNDVSYSPPPELSQRFPLLISDTNNNLNSNSYPNNRSAQSTIVTQEQLEIEKLKSELSSVSKQLCDLKQECSELKQERDTNKKLKSAHSNREASTRNAEAPILHNPRSGISPRCENATGDVASRISVEKRSIGLQTEKDDESAGASTSGSTRTYDGNPEMLSIWFPGNLCKSRRTFVANLLEMCATDFCLLFGCLNPNITSKTRIENLNHVLFPGNAKDLHSAEVAKASQLYSVLAKLSNDIADVDDLLEVLLDLCSLNNALVVLRSLRILHVALDLLLSMDRYRLKRDNVKVENCLFGSDAFQNHDSAVRKSGDSSGPETSGLSYPIASKSRGTVEHETISWSCHVEWLRVFESMRQITVRLTGEHARMEAVSIMNLILLTTDAYSERKKFGTTLVFEAVSLLLRKEAGFFLRKEVVHLLFLLLNCPDILATFCSSCGGAEDQGEAPNPEAKNSAFQNYSAILEGLANCIVCRERGVKELSLCRNAIMVVAFLASSGKSGIEIFLFLKLLKRTNFLGLILQVLVSEADVDASESCPAPEISKERTLLIREALILLNRVASHTVYSATVLQVLTSNRDLVSLAIEVANRLSKRSPRLLKSDNVTRQMRESEVVDLACVFKKRVYSFLGESISS